MDPPTKTNSYDFLIKLLLIGDSGVGKSCLLLRFAEDAFTPSFITTIGIDFKVRTVDIDGKLIKLQIWDTAGQERFRTITTAYYRGAMGILLVYDVTDEKSFNNINAWVRNIDTNATDAVDRVLLGNKCDVSDRKVVTTEAGQELADKLGIAFFETSARTGENVDTAFLSLAREIKKKTLDVAPPPAPEEGGSMSERRDRKQSIAFGLAEAGTGTGASESSMCAC